MKIEYREKRNFIPTALKNLFERRRDIPDSENKQVISKMEEFRHKIDYQSTLSVGLKNFFLSNGNDLQLFSIITELNSMWLMIQDSQQETSRFSSPDYLSTLSSIQKMQDVLRLTSGTSIESDEIFEREVPITEEIEKKIGNLEDFLLFKQLFKFNYDEQSILNFRSVLYRIKALIRSQERLDPKIAASLQQIVHEISAKMDSIRQLSVSTAQLSLEQNFEISFSYPNLPEGYEILADKDFLHDICEKLLPQELLSAVGEVSIGGQRKSSEEIEDGEVQGEFSPQYDENSRLVGSRVSVYHGFGIRSEFSKAAKEHKLNELLSTLFHEFGHGAHRMLTFAEMKMWRGIVTDFDVSVTKYVLTSVEIGEVRRNIEDFSDSFSYFLMKPAVLKLLSPERYEFMLAYFTTRMGEEQMMGFNRRLQALVSKQEEEWERLGKDKEALMSEYLPDAPFSLISPSSPPLPPQQ